MVRKAQMTTKFGGVIANFVEGRELPFSSTASDVLLQMVPHQSNSLDKTKIMKKGANVGQKEITASCACIEKNVKKANSLDVLFQKMSKGGNALVWLDPTLMPIECVSYVISKWLDTTRPTDNIGLGIIIPESNNATSWTEDFEAWTSTPSGPLKKSLEANDLLVWYPSLNRSSKFLEKITTAIKPFDIFPIVEFPQVIDYTSEKEIAAHHSLLDSYRTRTRNLIYLNCKSPEEALKTLFESFEAISRNGKMPRSLLVTPGGTSVSYLTTLLAGVFSGGIFITPKMEIPYPELRGIWGFAIFKKCE